MQVRELLPSEQGLRQVQFSRHGDCFPCQRVTSIRTRIKTHSHGIFPPCKGRSESYFHQNKEQDMNFLHYQPITSNVRELLPSEQGLRRVYIFIKTPFRYVRELLPSEQGLRLQFRQLVVFPTRSESYFHQNKD